MYEYRATVTRAIDGDTVEAVVDLGFRVAQTMRLRLLGVECPEMSDGGQAARLFTACWCHERPLIIRTHKDKADSFGRYLAEIEDADTSEMLNHELLLNGHAIVRLK